jgi:hypothetical protein
MDLSKFTIEQLLTLRHQISSRISVLRLSRTELRREHKKAVSQQRSLNIRSQLHNGDTVFFNLGLQSYQGTIRRKAEKSAAIEFYDPFAEQHKSHYVPYDRIRPIFRKGEQMSIVGNVHWIVNGMQTEKMADAQTAFSNLDQAKAQVVFAEASGDKEEIRLVRLAYRQFQGKRYRVEWKSTQKRSKKSVQRKASKSSRKNAQRASESRVTKRKGVGGIDSVEKTPKRKASRK